MIFDSYKGKYFYNLCIYFVSMLSYFIIDDMSLTQI